MVFVFVGPQQLGRPSPPVSPVWRRYETEEPSLRFTEKQLAEIRKVTMSHIMCQNCDEVDALQRALFDMPHDFL